MDQCIVANTDISGIGVRVATYVPNFLTLVPVIVALSDNKISRSELATTETASTTILLTAFALLFATIIGATTGDPASRIDNYHVTLVLNLSWMNNTNTFVYMLLHLHRILHPETRKLRAKKDDLESQLQCASADGCLNEADETQCCLCRHSGDECS